MAEELLEIEIVVGEDFAAQIFWTSEYGDPIPVSDPALMDVKDANGQIAMRFSSTADPATQPRLDVAGYVGFFQITAPRAVTQTLVPGRYKFDLFASVSDSGTPFNRQMQQVVSGYVLALPRTTIMEAAGTSIINVD